MKYPYPTSQKARIALRFIALAGGTLLMLVAYWDANFQLPLQLVELAQYQLFKHVFTHVYLLQLHGALKLQLLLLKFSIKT